MLPHAYSCVVFYVEKHHTLLARHVCDTRSHTGALLLGVAKLCRRRTGCAFCRVLLKRGAAAGAVYSCSHGQLRIGTNDVPKRLVLRVELCGDISHDTLHSGSLSVQTLVPTTSIRTVSSLTFEGRRSHANAQGKKK